MRQGRLENKTTMANMAARGKIPLLTVKDLNGMAFNMVTFAATCLLVTAKTARKAMEELKAKGIIQGVFVDMMAFEEFNDFIGFPEIKSLEGNKF